MWHDGDWVILPTIVLLKQYKHFYISFMFLKLNIGFNYGYTELEYWDSLY